MCEIYEKISELCKSKDISISQMCRELRISRSALSELKSGRSKSLTAKNTSLISGYFGITVEFLNGTGVFSNWREIMDHIENVIYKLQDELPANFYWHEDDDKYLFPLLHTRFYYGNDTPLFVNWLYSAVERITITEEIDDYYQDYDSYNDTPTVEVEFTFKKDFINLLNAQKAENERVKSFKTATFRDSLNTFIAQHQFDTSEESIEELVGIFRKLTFSSKKQLLGKAYELLDTQEILRTGEEEVAPPDIGLAPTRLDTGVKK